MARTFGQHSRELPLPRPAFPERWLTVARPVLSSTAGLLIGAALVGGAAFRLAPEPVVTPVAEPQSLAAPALPTAVASTPPASAGLAAPLTAASAPPVATEAPVVAAAPAAPPPPSLSAAPYRANGRLYAAVSADVGATLDAAIAGRVEVRLYQLIGGEIRYGANVAGLAYFPYVIVRSADRVLTLRPGALSVDSEVLVRDGSTVSVGAPLVRVVGPGASSWRTFYDRNLGAQVVASLTTAAGADLDAVPHFTRH